MPNAPDKAELEAAIYRHLSLQPAHEMPEALIVRVALLVTITLEYTRIVPIAGDQTVLLVRVPPAGVDWPQTENGSKTSPTRALQRYFIHDADCQVSGMLLYTTCPVFSQEKISISPTSRFAFQAQIEEVRRQVSKRQVPEHGVKRMYPGVFSIGPRRRRAINLRKVEQNLQTAYRDVHVQYRRDDELEVNTSHHRRLALILEQITSSFDHPISVLDMGCGTGRYFHCLKNVERLVGNHEPI